MKREEKILTVEDMRSSTKVALHGIKAGSKRDQPKHKTIKKAGSGESNSSKD